MKIIGSIGEPQAIRNGWSQTLGDYVEYVYKGSKTYSESIYSQVRGNCAEVEKDVEGPVGIVRVRYAGTVEPGGEEQLRIELRMARNDVQKSIFDYNLFGTTGGLSHEQLQDIKYIRDNPDDVIFFDGWLGTATAEEQALLALVDAGFEYQVVSQPILTQITTASSLFQWPDMTGNAGSVLSQQTLSGVLRQQPNFTLPGTNETAPAGYVYGWKMNYPTYESSSDGHSQEVIEFEFGLWPTQIYGNLV